MVRLDKIAIILLALVLATAGYCVTITIKMKPLTSLADPRFWRGRLWWKPVLEPLFKWSKPYMAPMPKRENNYAPPFMEKKEQAKQ